jgi:hypothetical protein
VSVERMPADGREPYGGSLYTAGPWFESRLPYQVRDIAQPRTGGRQ